MELELSPLNLPSDNERPFVIAGPCSAETEEQVMTTAKQLAMKGCHNFRAGVWKPRTKPGGFEGVEFYSSWEVTLYLVIYNKARLITNC